MSCIMHKCDLGEGLYYEFDTEKKQWFLIIPDTDEEGYTWNRGIPVNYCQKCGKELNEYSEEAKEYYDEEAKKMREAKARNKRASRVRTYDVSNIDAIDTSDFTIIEEETVR